MQWRGIWDLGNVYFRNDFPGGRLGGVVRNDSSRFTAVISGENYPINFSPWYAFQVWAESKRDIQLTLTYLGFESRYYPKISKDGSTFYPLDSAQCRPLFLDADGNDLPEALDISLTVGPDPIWVSAQEVLTSDDNRKWIQEMTEKPFVQNFSVGTSLEGRNLGALSIGGFTSDKGIMIISRQHPPEVTGYLAMQAFVQRICRDDSLARAFRRKYKTFVVPMLNPDGVDNGHWRHNMGGVDLNRDWAEFNQPETRAIKNFLDSCDNQGISFHFGLDFHSTWKDVYYPLDSAVTRPSAKIVYEWLEAIERALPDYSPRIEPSEDDLKPTIYARNHFYVAYNMPAVIFELGDNTSRAFLKHKAQIAAEELMKLLVEKEVKLGY